MKSDGWLRLAEEKLAGAGIGTARLDAVVLLEDELGVPRAGFLAESVPLSDSKLKALDKKLERRIKHEPLAYIRQKTEFYGRDFYIDKRILEPRPESETMLEFLQNLKLPTSSTIADIGTGSGALAISAKLMHPGTTVYATDIDRSCLEVALLNASHHSADIELFRGDLLEPLLNSKIDVVLANLPYIPTDWHINDSAKFEPEKAIYGGQDGLDLYRRLFIQTGQFKDKPRYILTESLPPQHKVLIEIAQQNKYRLVDSQDFIVAFATAQAELRV